MGGTATIAFADLERAIASRDPELGAKLVAYLGQDDPEPGRTELANDVPPDENDVLIDVPVSATTIATLTAAVSDRALANLNATERKHARRDAFAAAEASPYAPPRLRIAPLLMELDARGDAEARAALLEVFARGRMQWGVWKAAKAIYKRAERDNDAALFGVLAYRFDVMPPVREIGGATMVYMRRRSWRFLRQLGKAAPDAYVAFVVELLRHYGPDRTRYSGSWVASQVWNHKAMRGARNGSFGFYNDWLTLRAYPDAWKLSPAPLLRLLDVANNDIVVEFAIKSLRADHPLSLRAVEPAWLARLGKRPLGTIHEFVVSLLRESPELHQSKLASLGLHDVVLSFLLSPSAEARKYALEYAAAHAPTMTVDALVELIEKGASDVAAFAAARLEQMTAAQLGMPLLLRLLDRQAAPWAASKLTQGFSPKDMNAATFVDTSVRGTTAFNALIKFWNEKNATIPATYWTALVDDKRTVDDYSLRAVRQAAFNELAKRSAKEIGVSWVQRALENRATTDVVVRWINAGMLTSDELDVEWLKGLVGKPRLRPVALRLLSDRRRVAPAKVGLSWLLEYARSSDTDLAQFAQRMLLESFEPTDFAPGGDAAAGVARLWELAAGKKSPEAVRTFAATYLKAHHPDLGPRLPEARALGIKPRLGHEAYALATVRPLLSDERADVRRLAIAIAREEIVRWGDRDLVYELASASHKEPRGLGSELLLGMLETATEGTRIPAEWLDGRRLFQLAESAHKASREVALTLIRRLYARVGGAERLGWLMESPEREVRLFAVRLFWDRHRPKPWPDDYKPRKEAGAPLGTQRFTDLIALRQFARVILFGLPPGRVGQSDPVVEGAPKPERALPASIAKKRIIEALRDGALEDVELAKAIAPVLTEFTASHAKGEWQASLQALVALEAKHGALTAGGAS